MLNSRVNGIISDGKNTNGSSSTAIILLQIEMADTFSDRLRGLLGSDKLEPQTGLLIRPCCCVHTMGMRYPIDLVFLTREGVVVRTVKALMPNRLKYEAAAYQVLELAEGEVERLCIEESSVLNLEG